MGFHKESEMFLSVYSRINTDFKIIVPQKRNSTQSTSTVMNKLFMHNWNHWPSAMDWTVVQWRCKLIINNQTIIQCQCGCGFYRLYAHVCSQCLLQRFWEDLMFLVGATMKWGSSSEKYTAIIEYVNSNIHAFLDCITVQLQETTHH